MAISKGIILIKNEPKILSSSKKLENLEYGLNNVIYSKLKTCNKTPKNNISKAYIENFMKRFKNFYQNQSNILSTLLTIQILSKQFL